MHLIQVSGQVMTLRGSSNVPTPEGARVLWGGLMKRAVVNDLCPANAGTQRALL